MVLVVMPGSQHRKHELRLYPSPFPLPHTLSRTPLSVPSIFASLNSAPFPALLSSLLPLQRKRRPLVYAGYLNTVVVLLFYHYYYFVSNKQERGRALTSQAAARCRARLAAPPQWEKPLHPLSYLSAPLHSPPLRCRP